jgi:DNA invertase Pin-like site-specific DNA recombinase
MSNNIIAYCRISCDSATSCSLDYQESEIKKVATQMKWKIKAIDKEVISAYKSTSDRLNAYRKKKKTKIVFYSIDRFSRNQEAGTKLATDLLKKHNELFFIREKLAIKDIKSLAWKQFLHYLYLAERESKLIGERISASKAYLKQEGYCTSSVAPFGYKKRKLDNGRCVLDENTYDWHLLAFIEDCKTVDTSLDDLNKSLATIGGDTKKYPIEFDRGMDVLVTDLTYHNIANILDEYNVNVIGNGKWTASKVARIYKKNSIDIKFSNLSLINDETEDELYENETDDSEY